MTDVSKRHRTSWPKAAWVFSDPGRMLMFGMGSGLLRPGSGTWATLLVCFIYGCWAAERVAKQLGVPDHVGLVWDEFVAFWLVLWLVPQSLSAQALAFVLFRFFDVVKPPPIRQVDARFKGGVGVMLDDLLAAGYTLLVMALVIRFGVVL